MKYYIIAGEASGDLHAANLIKEIKKKDASAEIRCWGGDLMQAAGATLVKHYRDLAFMGFIEVLFNLKTILKNISFCKQDILDFKPDTLVFIDYPGFNMRIAKWAKPLGIKTHYYISPQIWAWKESRIKDIKRDVDHMHVILPFEKDFYEKKHGFPVNFVGHPLIDAIAQHPKTDNIAFRKEFNLDERPIIALLPGSRKQEITKMLDTMLVLPEQYPNFQFVIAGAPSQEASFYESMIKANNVKLISNRTYDILSLAHSALVTSGTATLETALFKIPQVVCYKANSISYAIAKRIINLKYISLVNLIMDKPIVAELIQNDFNNTKLKQEFDKISSGEDRKKILLEYFDLEQKLGGIGASKNTAELIVDSLNKNSK